MTPSPEILAMRESMPDMLRALPPAELAELTDHMLADLRVVAKNSEAEVNPLDVLILSKLLHELLPHMGLNTLLLNLRNLAAAAVTAKGGTQSMVLAVPDPADEKSQIVIAVVVNRMSLPPDQLAKIIEVEGSRVYGDRHRG